MQRVYVTIIETKYNNFVLQNKAEVNVFENESFEEVVNRFKINVSNETLVPVKYLKHKLYVKDNSQYYELFPEDKTITEYIVGENDNE